MKSDELQSLLLKTLTQRDVDSRLGHGEYYLAEHVKALAPPDDQPRRHEIMAAYWSLAAQGLAYIDLDPKRADQLEPTSHRGGSRRCHG